MAFLPNADLIYKTMREKKLPYFIVTDGNKSKLDENNTNINVEDAIAQLEQTLSYLSGNVTVKISHVTKEEKAKGVGTKDNFEYTLRLPDRTKSHGIFGDQFESTQTGSGLTGLLLQINELKLEIERQKFEVQKREVLKQAQEIAEDRGYQQREKLFDYWEKFLGLAASSKPAVNGQATISDNNNNMAKQEEKKPLSKKDIDENTLRLRKALHVLDNVTDHNLLPILEKLAKKAEEDPEKFKGLINMVV